jgi:osmotically-inducible protein OsmY
MKYPTTRTLAATLTIIGSAALMAACDQSVDDRTAGQKLDATVAKSEQKTAEMGSDIRSASKDAAQSIRSGADAVGDKVKDASITTAVNAKLAADQSLSALRIDVDTVDGAVVLRGTAPDSQAREHATTLASSVDGVTRVDNQLVVSPKG